MKLAVSIKIGFLTVTLVGTYVFAFAQHSYKYSAAVEKVDSSGFYSISLDPRLIAKSKFDLSDIRLVNSRSNFVPYVLSDRLPKKNHVFRISFPHADKIEKTDTLTAFVFKNKARISTDHLWIKMRNTAVSRSVNILGSDDLKNWFAVREDVLLKKAGLNPDGNYEQILHLPASTYSYMKIQLNGKNRTPVNILQAGIYTRQLYSLKYQLLSGVNYIQKDSGKISFLTIKFPVSYQVNKLHLKVKGTKFYKRQISVYTHSGGIRDQLTDTILTSSGTQDIYISARTNKLKIEIHNEDNMPLKIENVSASQLNIPLISYLEKGEAYNLFTGDSNAIAPNYDLQSFTDSIQNKLPEIGHAAILANALFKTAEIKPDTFKVWFIWVAVAAVLIVLLYLTHKMTKEINKKSVS